MWEINTSSFGWPGLAPGIDILWSLYHLPFCTPTRIGIFPLWGISFYRYSWYYYVFYLIFIFAPYIINFLFIFMNHLEFMFSVGLMCLLVCFSCRLRFHFLFLPVHLLIHFHLCRSVTGPMR